MSRERTDLDPLLSPESVAVVGASPDSWYSSQLVDNMLEYGYDGPLYLVNPNRDTAWGRICYDNLSDIPEVVDLVIISIPREYVVEVVEQADTMGIPAAIVLTAGFSEADESGGDIEDELSRVVDEREIRVCGPNCIGLANTHKNKVLTSTCSRQPTKGSIGLVSHSGALAFTTFFERGEDEDTGFAYIVSTGNEVDQDLTDYVEYMMDDDKVGVITTYIEGIDEPRRFMRVADAMRREGKPILSIKVGQSDSADTATVSHTGSLTGNDAAWEAAFEQTGVQRVDDIPDLLAKAKAHAAFDPPDSNNVCIASTSGGLASLLADFADLEGLNLPALSNETEQSLLDLEGLMTFGSVPNPADIRGYGADHLPAIADSLFADDSFDAYLFAIGLSAVDERAEEIADDLITVAEMASDPVLFLWTGRKEPVQSGPQPYERVRKEAPLYYDPKTCVEALASLVRFGRTQNRAKDQPSRRKLVSQIDEVSRQSLPQNSILSWREATELLEAENIPVEKGEIATSAEESAQLAAEIGFPVVLKVDSPAVPHRSRIDAVKPNVDDEDSARKSYEEIIEQVHSVEPAADINGVIVQPQVETGVEILFGVSTDPDFGSLVTVGRGGTDVEAIDDQTLLIPPFTQEDAKSALQRTTVPAMLREHGYESAIEGLSSMLVDVGNLAVRNPPLAELDLNPVIVNESGCHVIDALVRTQ